jgi:hypothetical protein
MNATEKAIRENFPGKNNAGLRKLIRAACPSKSAVDSVWRSVALTASGDASMRAVIATLPSELEECGPDEKYWKWDADA